MKFRSCWLIFTLIALSLTSCSQPKSSQEIAETVKNSIVLISYQNESGHGTGFIVAGPAGVCTVLTARHVVEGRSLNLQTNDQKLHKTNSIQASPNLDLAVVTFQSAGDKCPYPSLNFGDSDSVKQTDQIYISGFPDRAGGGKLVRQFVRGSVSGLDVLEQGYGISYDANTFGGMSGGPVLDASGKVVAVHGKTDAQIVADLQSQQASLSPQQQVALQQAAARVAGGGVQVNTFRWGIPIKTYLANQSNLENKLIAKVDYTKLEQLLEAGKWKEADGETTNKMLEVAGRQKEGWIDIDSIKNFSCPDLRAMDRLWVKYSDGRFGFSVQRQTYQSLRGTKEHDKKVWLKYGEEIGWKQRGEKGEWMSYSQLTFDTNAPKAHLPAGWSGRVSPSKFGLVGVWMMGWNPEVKGPVQTLVTCNL
ncbi:MULTISPECIES: GUN4 domain-containing protein [unclassified Microcoleus]|uniref:GUN4 domain-containing protein n=1 Tax=unclassified Microcoleus TaxID=2642155 RepID=UPI0025ED8B03|nr:MULTISPECIES: GUN4 domain-containing protein [unclassified Microcoleus]